MKNGKFEIPEDIVSFHANVSVTNDAVMPYEPKRNAVIVEVDNEGVLVSIECKDKSLQWALDRLAREILEFVN